MLDLIGDFEHVAVGAVVNAAAVNVVAVKLVDEDEDGDVGQGQQRHILADGVTARVRVRREGGGGSGHRLRAGGTPSASHRTRALPHLMNRSSTNTRTKY